MLASCGGDQLSLMIKLDLINKWGPELGGRRRGQDSAAEPAAGRTVTPAHGAESGYESPPHRPGKLGTGSDVRKAG
jgi:hypothetical protein